MSEDTAVERGPTSLPLLGVRVLDLTRLMPGAYCTFLLAALGADVLKIEDPGAGDYMRSFGTPVQGQGAIHHVVNRAKRSAVIDLKQADGVAVLRSLVRRADLLVESFRPGVLDRLGLGDDDLRAIRPSLVTVSLSGYGATGEMARVAGHDINYTALTGLLERTGTASSAPVITPVQFADLIGGSIVPALGAVALLLQARQTGRGAHLDNGMAEAIALLPSILVADLLAGSPAPGRGASDWGGGLACWRVYPLRDGHVAVGAVEPQFWAALCNALGAPDLIETQYSNSEQQQSVDVLTRIFRSHDRESIERLLDGVDVCTTVVRSYEELITSTFARDRDLIHRHPSIPVPVLAAPFMIDGQRPAERSRAPFQGEHTVEALTEWGVDAAEVERLLAGNAIRQWHGEAPAAGQAFGARPGP